MSYRLYSRHGGAAAATLDEITDRAPAFSEGAAAIHMGTSFQNGGSSLGTFLVNDPIANVDEAIYLPPHTYTRWTEDAAGCEYWLTTGRVTEISVGRGVELGGDHLEWDVSVEDGNADLRGLAFTEDWVRPAETDTARLYALQAYTLNGTGSTRPNSGSDITYRPSTIIAASNTHLAPNTNTVSLPAKTYPAGTQPQEIIDDCATTAGKVYGVVIHHAPVGGSLVLTYSFNANSDGGDTLVWSGLLGNQAGGAAGTSHYYFDGHSNSLPANGYAFAPGQQIQVTGFGGTDGESLLVEFLDSGNVVLGGPHYVFQGAGDGGANFGHWGAVDSGVLTAPTGTVKWRFNKTSHIGSSGIDFDELRVYLSPLSTDCSHLCLEYILETDHTTYASVVKISDQIADWNPDDFATPVFEPKWDQGKGFLVDAHANVSGLVSRYGIGNAFINDLDPATGDIYEYWNDEYQDSDSVNSTQATARANAIAAYRRLYDQTDQVTIAVHPEQTYLLTAGMSLQIKTTVTGGGATLGDYLTRRIVELVWQPREDGMYWAQMHLNRGLRRLPASRGKTQPAATSGTVPAAGTSVPGYSASGSVGTSQSYLPVDSVLPFPPTVAKTLTNKSGGGVIAGDVVVPDTANNDAFTTTTSADASGSVWVAQATIANNASGVVAVGGYVALVNTTASVTRGHFGGTSTTVKKAHDQGASPTTGSFMQFLSSGTTPDAVLGNFSGGASITVATDPIWDAKGDLAVGTGADTASKLTVGADDTILMADASTGTGLKWVASATPSTQALGDSAAAGTADTFTRGDHKHAMPAAAVTTSGLTQATAKLLGRTSASTGAIEEITVGGGLTFSAGSLSATGGSAVIATDTLWDAKGDLAAGTGADSAAKLTVGSDNSVLVPDASVSTGLKWVASPADATKYFDGSGNWSVPGVAPADLTLIPKVTQAISNFQTGATTNVATLGATPTRGLIAAVMQSSATDPTSITQTNVTWTKRYSGTGSSQGVNIWTGAVSGTAGTVVTATWAGSTKSQLEVYEMDHADFTAVGTAVTATGLSTSNPTELGPLTTPSLGDICIFALERNALASSYSGMNLPFHSVSPFGGQGVSGVFFFRGTASVWQVPSASAAYFAAMMKIS